MERVVIHLQVAVNGLPGIVLEEPLTDPEAEHRVDLKLEDSEQKLLALIKTGPWEPDLVEKVGTVLCAWLRRQPAINRDFTMRLDPNGHADGPIYLRVEPPEIDEWPWEALNDPNTGFLALQRRWPIARVKRVAVSKPEYVFVPPLRIMVVLGASGADAQTRISAREEWQELLKAILQSRLNISLRVLVCEDELLDEINALGHPWIDTGFLTDENELFTHIRAFAPQIVHFFCHGLADQPTPYLQIGNRVNWKRKEHGTINIEASQLRERADPDQNVWLITLNCCESAQAAAGSGSRSRPMAASLVLRGFPAVVGMRERVLTEHAHRFCGLWYDALLQELRSRFTNPGAHNDPVHWGSALFAARQGICTLVEQAPMAESARRHIEWTIPVLYSRSQPFTVHLAPDPNGEHPVMLPAVSPAAGGPVPARVPAPGLSLEERLRLTAELEELINVRDDLASKTNIPARIREGLIQDITARLAAIESQLS